MRTIPSVRRDPYPKKRNRGNAPHAIGHPSIRSISSRTMDTVIRPIIMQLECIRVHRKNAIKWLFPDGLSIRNIPGETLHLQVKSFLAYSMQLPDRVKSRRVHTRRKGGTIHSIYASTRLRRRRRKLTKQMGLHVPSYFGHSPMVHLSQLKMPHHALRNWVCESR
ncbi:hypothetical protein TRVA0_024S00870 [Trichomonascus vanleenenianus]|uniref:uncharacterized protein n=1 Tax=Trichomonascus vanleenenianus TaxID=2268995 RepID=UPI003ECA44D4